MFTTRSGRWVGAALCLTLVAAGCTQPDDDARGILEPEVATEVRGDGTDGYSATIRRTDGGIPHITGATLADASFGQGWASGEDRACDLADQVLKINGERAKWLGPGEDDENIESDLAWRSIGIRAIAGEDWETASDAVRTQLTAYTEGWNAQLRDVGADGLGDWCAGQDWVRELEPVEVYSYARSIALQASSGAVSSMIPSAAPPGAEVPAEEQPAATDGPATDEPATDEPGANEEEALPAPDLGDGAAAVEPVAASNGWAIGSERSADGGGMLVANPHFPWEGQLRFWEVHLTVPGEADVYGVQLSGLPGLAIGFTEEFGWTHTVSDGSRFTAYRLDLVPGSPTTYRYGDEEREMTSEDVTIDVLGEDGTTTQETRTMWRSHYGPILDFPGFGWTDSATITMRDANIDNDEFIDQYLALVTADGLDDLIAINEEFTGVPLFNTVATSADGRAWYADTSATPNLSDEAEAAYLTSLDDDPIVQIAADNGAVLLDGSDPLFEWEVVEGARDPGLVPFSEMPAVERDDYVFNANDSFWMPHATEMLEGDYSVLHGFQDTARTPRTRENATVLDDTGPDGPSGEDARFDLDELADASLANRGYTARALLEPVVERCTGSEPVMVEPLLDDDGVEVLPAGQVDLTEACEVLGAWDGVYDVDSVGPPIWREFLARYESSDLLEDGPLWADPFVASDPLDTPSGLASPADGEPDLVLVNLARAVQTLEAAKLSLDVPLGDVQAAVRNGTQVPIHGGNGPDGTTNVVGFGGSWATLDPALTAIEREPFAPNSSLATVTDGTTTTVGYRINNGTSFLMALEYTNDGPRAKSFLTYGNTANREDPAYTEATERFSTKSWRDILFREEDVADGTIETVQVQG